jgi:chromosome transmission fidelity protein 1
MPYPNPTDPELQERMAFLDKGGTSFTGQQYYEDLCMKAVNQCIGRVIRHRGDHAAVLLVDSRCGGDSRGSQGRDWTGSQWRGL